MVTCNKKYFSVWFHIFMKIANWNWKIIAHRMKLLHPRCHQQYFRSQGFSTCTMFTKVILLSLYLKITYNKVSNCNCIVEHCLLLNICCYLIPLFDTLIYHHLHHLFNTSLQQVTTFHWYLKFFRWKSYEANLVLRPEVVWHTDHSFSQQNLHWFQGLFRSTPPQKRDRCFL